MFRLVTFIALASAISMVAVTTAQAAKPCSNAGYCAPGTCAKNGGKRACDLKNCSKQNCR
jgi:hypothetical protein